MNSKKILFGLVFLGLVVLVSGVGSSVECGNIPTDDCTVSVSTTFAFGAYYFNDTNTNGAIKINGSNLNLDFNGSILQGNFTSNSRGLYLTGDNITITNFTIRNYNQNVRSDTSLNNTLRVGTIGNATGWAINHVTSNYSTIDNLLFTESSGTTAIVSLSSSSFSQVINSNFTNINLSILLVNYAENITIKDNSFFNVTKGVYRATSALNLNNLNVINNTVEKAEGFVEIYGSSGSFNNINISLNNFNEFKFKDNNFKVPIYLKDVFGGNNIINYNNFNNLSVSIHLKNGSGFLLSNNNFSNMLYNFDSYADGIYLVRGNNITIINNNFNNLGCTGVLSVGVNNLNISYNVFDTNISSNIANQVNCAYEPISAIKVAQLYKTWTGDGNTPTVYNITTLQEYSAQNISIYGNTISDNIPVLLKSQGITNLMTDISSYWYKKFQLSFLTQPTELYINNNWNNITTIRNNTDYFHNSGTNYFVSSSIILGEGNQSSLNGAKFRFTITKEYELYNNTYNFANLIPLFNKTNSLIYFSNGSVACSNIATCDNNINITLTPNNYSYVLDNFNLTEGVTRQFSPISVSGTSTSKTITSQLSQAINATVIVDVSQCSFKATYEGSNIQEDSCADGQATFTLIDIPASESFLELSYLDLNCSSNTGASIAIILIFSALAIVAITFIIVMKFKEGELDVKILIIVFIALIVGLVLFTQIAQLTGSVCN